MISIRKMHLTLIGGLICLSSLSQTTELIKIDSELTTLYKSMLSADPQLRFEKLAPEFKKQLSKQLVKPIIFNKTLDSLSVYLTIKSSPDKSIKFYSWDEHTGGTWHTIQCFAQFKSKNGTIHVKQLSSENESITGGYTSSEIYEVHEINNDKTRFYLTFAWGTHGGGYQHAIIRLFKIDNDKLTTCESCLVNTNNLVIEYSRSDKLNLTFNPTTQEITYNEFIKTEESERYTTTGKTITLKLVNGIYKVK